MRLARLAVALCLALGASGAAGAPSSIETDEEVLFFPGCAWRSADGSRWVADVHAWVFEPERDSVKRDLLLAPIRTAVGLKAGEAGGELFLERALPFLADNERGKRLAIRIGRRAYALAATGPDGHAVTRIEIPVDPAGPAWVDFHEEPAAGPEPRFFGRVRLLAPEGLSVVSDIDDTIKASEVRDRKALLANTFLRPFAPVEGMSELYRAWASSGAAFHYVSASPWQLYAPLAEFLKTNRFPDGSMHMKAFRWKDRSAFSPFGKQEGYKRGAILPLLRAFPARRFVLVGDSGEQDPEIFGALARAHPDRVAAVFIRDAGGGGAGARRYAAAFAGLRPGRWKVFKSPAELPAGVGELLQR